MKTARVLLVHCGFRGWVDALSSARTGSADPVYELEELDIGQAPSEGELDGVSRRLAGWRPAVLMLIGLPEHAPKPFAQILQRARQSTGEVRMVAVCPEAAPETVTELLDNGAAEVLTNISSLAGSLLRLVEAAGLETSEDRSTAQLRGRLGLSQIVGESPPFVEVVRQIPAVAKYDVCVLILGETGTGKEVFARAIHYHSARSAKPFVPINCGAIPLDLVENEFFGHEPGAFTSANASRKGVIREAEGGTLFLDEVDCLPPLAQVKLLRFLQDGHFRALGAERSARANVRLIAASNLNLREATEAGRFRRDLFYRLNVLPIELPPLRQRGGDILLLARHFLELYSQRFGAHAREFTSAALQKLVSYDWPGNVRELENVIQRAIVLSDRGSIGPEELQCGNREPATQLQSFRELKAKAIGEFERNYVGRLLQVHGGNITKAAQSAGKDRRAFWELMRKHRITAHPPISPSPDKSSRN